MQELGSASDFDDGYDSDLMGDEADRARLAGMTELEREMELAERSERRDEIKERRQTARVLKQQQRSAAKVLRSVPSFLQQCEGFGQANRNSITKYCPNAPFYVLAAPDPLQAKILQTSSSGHTQLDYTSVIEQ